MPSLLLSAAGAVTATNRFLARIVAWCSLLMVLLSFAVVLLRYGLDWGSIAMQESVVYLHAALFMLAAAGALADDSHVRVDILYARCGERRRALINAGGALFLLLPFALFLGWICWDYVVNAWSRGETSAEAGGLPWVWALKTLLLILPVQLALQALASLVISLNQLLDRR